MKLIRYTATFFDVNGGGNSYAKFEAGRCYPITDESARHVVQGIAEEIDAPEDAAKAETAAQRAQAAADRAQQAAEQARALADAAVVAQRLADEQAAADAAAAASAQPPAGEQAAAATQSDLLTAT